MLQIEQLNKRYDNGVQALDALSLEIPRGMFGLLGPNGAGKSTLMRTLATLQQPDSGAIRFNGLDVLAEPVQLRSQLGYLPQDFGVYPRLSPAALLDHIALLKGIGIRHERDRLVRRLLELTNLWDVRSRRLDSFSGGMRQRFGIAQALIGDPQLVIVDEPTAGLDPTERHRFHNLLSQLSENIVVLLSTHIVDDVADLCTNMAIIGNGRLLARGAPSALIAQLRNQLWTRACQREECANFPQLISTRLSGGQLYARVLGETPPDSAFTAAEPSLEDVYFATLNQHGIRIDL